MIFSILAIDKNNLIGNKNKLPWHYKKDLDYFKEKTHEKEILVGYTTYVSLTQEYNFSLNYFKAVYVVSKKQISNNLINPVYDLNEFIKNRKKDLWIIGGKKIFESTLKYSDVVYLTKINKSHVGDVYLNFNFADFLNIREVKNNELNFLTLIKKDAFIFNIKDVYLKSILRGEKTFEFRLNTEERKKIKSGDLIYLKSANDVVAAKVASAYFFNSRKEVLLKHFETDFVYCFKNKEDALKELSKYYADLDIEKYGLVAYELSEVKSV